MNRLLLILFAFTLSFKVSSQCNYVNNTFKANEYVSYEVYYNWGFIWLNAGEASFKTAHTYYKNIPAIKLYSKGQSHPNYDWFFKVRDQFESIINPLSVLPYSFTKQTHEGNYYVNNKYTFVYPENSIYTTIQNSNTPLKTDTIKNQHCTFDVLSIIYACRSINFNNKEINDTIPLHTIVDGEINHLYIRYLGKENIVNKDLRQFSCNKFSVKMVAGTIFKGDESLTVWVTNDKNQIPVYVEAEILVGSIKAFVNEIKGVKWPANYHIFTQDN